MTGAELSTDPVVAACQEASQRLFGTLADLDDDTARRASRLPGWSVGHVLTHLARNADGHVRRLSGALRGDELARYPGGPQQRDRDIEVGAARPAADLVADVVESARRLDEVWAASRRAGWPNSDLLAGDRWPTTASPHRRLREVEVHHVDLGLGYELSDWPADYVQQELPLVLAGLPERLEDPADARRLLAWLIGRADAPDQLPLKPW